MDRLARTLACGLSLCLLLSLSGCQTSPEYDAQRLAALSESVDSFLAASPGEVVCDFTDRETTATQGFAREVGVANASSWDAVVDTLTDVGFVGPHRAPSLSMNNQEGITVSAMQIDAAPGEDAELKSQFQSRGCTVPRAGFVYVRFVEFGSS